MKGSISEKEALRKVLINKRVCAADENKARAAIERILPLLSGKVMVYVSMGSELPTRELIERLWAQPSIEVFVPYTADGFIMPRKIKYLAEPDKLGDLPEQAYDGGICEAKLDFCVTPLLGFNLRGYRIGYGKGCYDRFFSRHPECKRIGLCYSFQQVEFAEEEHDVPLGCCVTDEEVIYF